MSVLLSNPDYLLEGFAEKRCKVIKSYNHYKTMLVYYKVDCVHYHCHYVLQYIGIIDDIPTTTDLSNRGYLLATLDDKRVS